VSGISKEHRLLVDRYVDDLSSPEEVARLNQLLVECPGVAEYFAGVARLNSLLLEQAREKVIARAESAAVAVDEAAGSRRVRGSSSRRRRPVSRRRKGVSGRLRAGGRGRHVARGQTVKGRRGRRSLSPVWLLAAGAAAAAVILLAAHVFRGEPPPAVSTVPAWTAKVREFRGKPKVYRGADEIALKPGVALRAGDRVLTDKGSLLALRYDDGTVVELNRGGRLTLGAPSRSKQLVLDSGDLYITAMRQPRGHPLMLNPGGYDQVMVVGTQLEMCRFGNTSVLKVAAGRVRFGAAGKLAVPERHASRVARGGKPEVPRPTDTRGIAPWRRNRPPWIEPVTVRTGANMPARVVLSAGDRDGDHLRYELTRLPKHGKMVGSPPDLIYEPFEGFSGEDELRVRVSDGLAESEEVKIALEVTAVEIPLATRPLDAPPAPKLPTALLEAGPGRGKAPLSVNFYAQGSRAADGGKVKCAWNFGDGSRGEGMTAKHTYREPGEYTARLTVTDAQGLKASREFKVTVLDLNSVSAPTRMRWHYKKKGGQSYFSWRDNSDNEDGFYVERAMGRGKNLKFERVATLDAGQTHWRVELPRGGSGKWFTFRIRAFRTGEDGKTRVSAASNAIPIRWGSSVKNLRDVNWPPPWLRKTK